MIKINAVVVGKVKERYFSEAIDEYAKRLSRFCEFKIIEIPEENYSKTDDGIVSEIKKREGERILKKVSGYCIAMAINGKKTSSENLSDRIKKLAASGKGEISFIIGGSYGLSDEVIKSADELMSFSDLTFPHTLFRVMLTEQLYRAFTIINGVAYHK